MLEPPYHCRGISVDNLDFYVNPNEVFAFLNKQTLLSGCSYSGHSLVDQIISSTPGLGGAPGILRLDISGLDRSEDDLP